MYQKLIFLSTFNLVGALHDFPTIGNVARYYYKEVSFYFVSLPVVLFVLLSYAHSLLITWSFLSLMTLRGVYVCTV
jgi:hypothetical protein